LPTATTELVRALRLLARRPDGCPEAVMLAEGFKIAFLAGLVRNGLVTAELTAARVVRVQTLSSDEKLSPADGPLSQGDATEYSPQTLARRK
jgi:hypothetical protein